MADHFSGPRVLQDPTIDITDLYAFPSPDRPGRLVIIMNVFPVATPDALFSDAVIYRLRVRPVTGLVPGSVESVFDLTFSPGGATCRLPSGEEFGLPTTRDDVRVFTGPRLDPFFIDLRGVTTTTATGKLSFEPDAVNPLDGMNVLSIVIEVDPAVHLPPGPVYAVVGETLTRTSRPVRLERMGRPEIKNIVMSPRRFDPVNRDLEIRDVYNEEDAFALRPDYLGAFRARLDANLAFFDGLDGTTDWPADPAGSHPLTGVLLNDFLMVDAHQDYDENGYLEIESSFLGGLEHATCGGRTPNHDIVATLYGRLVGGPTAPPIAHGVSAATRPATLEFPYLNAPNPAPPDPATVLDAQRAPE